MISIIVALYNEEKNIEKCIESVLAQTMKDYELILVDDGSDDGSSLICDKYAKKDNRIKVIHKDNGGLISARMCGVCNSTADFLTFLDADDWVEEDFYEKLYAPIYNDNKIDIVVSAFVVDKKSGSISTRFKFNEEGLMDKKRAIIDMYKTTYYDWSGCAKIYRKALATQFVDKWWFDEPIGEDVEWNWKLFNSAEKIFFVSFCGYHYFENNNSMTHKKIDMKNLVILDRIEKMISETSDDEKELLEILWYLLAHKCIERLTRMIYYEENKDQEIEKCRKTITKIPLEIKKKFPSKIVQELDYYLMDPLDFIQIKEQKDDEILKKYIQLNNNGATNIFIYGAGTIGEYISYLLDKKEMCYKGFIVTKINESGGQLNNREIIDIETLKNTSVNHIGVLLALNEKNKKQVENLLNEINIFNYQDVGKYTLYY